MNKEDILSILNTQFEIIGDVEFVDSPLYSGIFKEKITYQVELFDNEYDSHRNIIIEYNKLNDSILISDRYGVLPIKNLEEFSESIKNLSLYQH